MESKRKADTDLFPTHTNGKRVKTNDANEESKLKGGKENKKTEHNQPTNQDLFEQLLSTDNPALLSHFTVDEMIMGQLMERKAHKSVLAAFPNHDAKAQSELM
jgi:hypothetical protein